jgi:chondroitin AC lyase
VTISANGKESVIGKGEKVFENLDWVYHDGIGYVVLDSSNLNIKNSEAMGSWWKINMQTDSPKDEVKLDVFKLWVDHGSRPSDASYEYMVVPATSIDKLQSGESKNNVEVLSNTPEIQAVRNRSLDIVEIVFYKAGELALSDGFVLKSYTPGIYMLKTANGGVEEISVADPNRELSKMNFSLSKRIDGDGENYQAVWNDHKQATQVSIDLPEGQLAGKSVTVKLN